MAGGTCSFFPLFLRGSPLKPGALALQPERGEAAELSPALPGNARARWYCLAVLRESCLVLSCHFRWLNAPVFFRVAGAVRLKIQLAFRKSSAEVIWFNYVAFN